MSGPFQPFNPLGFRPKEPVGVTYVPVSTVAGATWSVSGAALHHLAVDETIAGTDEDISYIFSNSSGQLITLNFPTGIPDPGTDGGHLIKTRFRRQGGSGSSTLTQTFRSDAVDRASLVGVIPTGAYTNIDWILSVGEAGAIVDYNTLQLRLLSNTISPSETLRVTEIEMFFVAGIETRLTRHVLEILAKTAATPHARITREAVEVLAKTLATPNARLTRMAVEVLGRAITEGRLTRYAIEVLARPPSPHPSPRLTRMAIEVLGENIYEQGVSPGAIPGTLINYFMGHWGEGVTLESSWTTSIFDADSAAEERSSLVDRPVRRMRGRLRGLSTNEALKLSMNLHRLSHSTFQPVPLYCDQSRVLASSTGTVIWCNTAYRRFSAGARVAVHDWASVSIDGRTTNRPANVQYPIVLSVASDHLTLTSATALAHTYPIGSRVFPAMDVAINLDGTSVMPSGHTWDLALDVHETVGETALTPTTLAIPTAFQLSAGMPILDARRNNDKRSGIDVAITRDGEESPMGRGSITFIRGERPRGEFDVDVVAKTRAKAWPYIELFDYARGRARAFWLIPNTPPYTVTAINATSVVFDAFGNYQDIQEFVDFVSIVKKDGTQIIAPVVGTTDGGASWTVLFASIGSILLSDVAYVGPGHMIRIASDTLREQWETDEHVTISMRCKELLQEKSVVIANVTETVVLNETPELISDLYFWSKSSANAWLKNTANDRLELATHGDDRVGVWDDVRAAYPSPPPTFLQAENPGQQDDVGRVVFFSAASVNNGKPTLMLSNANYSGPAQAIGDKHFFDSTLGFTYIISMRHTNNAFSFQNSGYEYLKQTGVIEHGRTQLKIFETLDVVDNDLYINALPDLRTGEKMIIVLTWKPGVYLRMYKNGQLVGTGPVRAATVMPVSTRDLFFYNQIGRWDNPTETDIGESPSVNEVLIYKRALTASELNSLCGVYLKNEYSHNWTNVT